MDNYRHFVYGYQVFDYILIFLILFMGKLGFILMLVQIVGLTLLQVLNVGDFWAVLVRDVGEYSMSWVRQFGYMGVCLAFI